MPQYRVTITDPKTGKKYRATFDHQPSDADVSEVESSFSGSAKPRGVNISAMSDQEVRESTSPFQTGPQVRLPKEGEEDPVRDLLSSSVRVRAKRGEAPIKTNEDRNVPPSQLSRRPMDPIVSYDPETGEALAPVWWLPSKDYVRLSSLPANGKGVTIRDPQTGQEMGVRAATPDDINTIRSKFPEYKSDDELFNLYGLKDFANDQLPEATVTAASGGLAGGVASGMLEGLAEGGSKVAGNALTKFALPLAVGGGASLAAQTGLEKADEAYDPALHGVSNYIKSEYRRRHPYEATALEQAPNFAMGNPARWGGLVPRAVGGALGAGQEFVREGLQGEETNPGMIALHGLAGLAQPTEGGLQGAAHGFGKSVAGDIPSIPNLSERFGVDTGDFDISGHVPEFTRDNVNLGELPTSTPNPTAQTSGLPLPRGVDIGQLPEQPKLPFRVNDNGQEESIPPIVSARNGSILSARGKPVGVKTPVRGTPSFLQGPNGPMVDQPMQAPPIVPEQVGLPILNTVRNTDPAFNLTQGKSFLPDISTGDIPGLNAPELVPDNTLQQRFSGLLDEAPPVQTQTTGLPPVRAAKPNGQLRGKKMGSVGGDMLGMMLPGNPDGTYTPEQMRSLGAAQPGQLDQNDIVEQLARYLHLGESPNGGPLKSPESELYGPVRDLIGGDNDRLFDIFNQATAKERQMSSEDAGNYAPDVANQYFAQNERILPGGPASGGQTLRSTAMDLGANAYDRPIQDVRGLAQKASAEARLAAPARVPGTAEPDVEPLRQVVKTFWGDMADKYDPVYQGLAPNENMQNVANILQHTLDITPPLGAEYDRNRIFYSDEPHTGFPEPDPNDLFHPEFANGDSLLHRPYQSKSEPYPYRVTREIPTLVFKNLDEMAVAAQKAATAMGVEIPPTESMEDIEGVIKQYAEMFGSKVEKIETADRHTASGTRDNVLESGMSTFPKDAVTPFLGEVERPGMSRLRERAAEGLARSKKAEELMRQAIKEASGKLFSGADPEFVGKYMYGVISWVSGKVQQGVFNSAADVTEFLSRFYGESIGKKYGQKVFDEAQNLNKGGTLDDAYRQMEFTDDQGQPVQPANNPSRLRPRREIQTPSGQTISLPDNETGIARYPTKTVRQRGVKLTAPGKDANPVNPDVMSNFFEDVKKNRDTYARYRENVDQGTAERLAEANSYTYRKDMTPAERRDAWYKVMRGEFDHGIAPHNDYSLADQQEITGFIQQAGGNPTDNAKAQFAALAIMNGSKVQPAEFNRLADVFGPNIERLQEPKSVFGLRAANSILKTLKFGMFDRSAPLSTALPLTLRGLIPDNGEMVTPQALKKMWQVSFGSRDKQIETYNELINEIGELPNIKSGKVERFGGFFPGMRDVGSGPSEAEWFELAKNAENWEEKMRKGEGLPAGFAPLAKMFSYLPGEVMAAERAFNGYTNWQKAQRYNQMFDLLQQQGFSTENPEHFDKFRQATDMVNNMAGHGKYKGFGFGKVDAEKWKGFGDLMSSMFNAPRYAVASARTGNPLYWKTLIFQKDIPVAMKQEYLKNALASTMAGFGMMTAYALRGGNITLDPHNPDWGQFTVGDTRVNFFGGHLSLARAIAAGTMDAVRGARHNVGENSAAGRMLGKVAPGKSPYGEDPEDYVYEWAKQRVSPAVGLGLSAAKGRVFGQQGSTPSAGEISRDLLMPAFLADEWEVFSKTRGNTARKAAATAITSPLASHGLRIQTPDKKSQQKRKQPRGIRLLPANQPAL